jgi:ABC-type multidrug transport system fused ATPase/permease subunit
MAWGFVCLLKKGGKLIAGEGSRMIASGDLNVGTVLTVVLAVMVGAFSLALVAPRIETFAKATAASQKIFQTLQRVPSIDSLDDRGEKPAGIKGSLELKGVSFVYPARPEGLYIQGSCPESSYCVEEYRHFHPRGEIHCDCGSIRLGKIDCFTIT